MQLSAWREIWSMQGVHMRYSNDTGVSSFDGNKKLWIIMDMNKLIMAEKVRQEAELSLIASENYAPEEILRMVGSVLTNKYAEGYPGKRYYAGCDVIDEIERSAMASCTSLFGSEYANLQPHAGAIANLAAYFAFAKPGDSILSMDFRAGGHLTHGAPANITSRLFNFIHYGLHPETQMLDFAEIEKLAHEHRPKIIIAGASAYSRVIDFEIFARIARDAGAVLLADIAHIAGPIAAGLHPSPVPYADCVTGTTHKTLRGPRGGFIMSRAAHAQAIDRAVMPGIQGGPCMHVIAAKGRCFELAQTPEFKSYQELVLKNARFMAGKFLALGYPVVSGGTDTHLFILDLRFTGPRGLTGKQAEESLAQAGILVSRSCIPGDTQSPAIGSGIRLGTPALTARGMGLPECEEIVGFVHDVLRRPDDRDLVQRVRVQVKALCEKYPAYPKQLT
jgi:glycine hydroxymethyltransferase